MLDIQVSMGSWGRGGTGVPLHHAAGRPSKQIRGHSIAAFLEKMCGCCDGLSSSSTLTAASEQV